MLLGIAVFLSDACIGYWGGRYFDARQSRQRLRALWYSLLLDLAIGVNAMGFVTVGWWMLGPSVVGGLLGTYLSMRRE